MMKIHINTDNNVEGRDALAAWVSSTIESALVRHGDHITRVEAHLSDENGPKSGQNDKRCLLEARLEGRPPISVSEHSDTLEEAVSGAAEKLARLINSKLGRVAARLEKPTD